MPLASCPLTCSSALDPGDDIGQDSSKSVSGFMEQLPSCYLTNLVSLVRAFICKTDRVFAACLLGVYWVQREQPLKVLLLLSSLVLIALSPAFGQQQPES